MLRAVPCRKSVFSDRLPTQIPVLISPTEWVFREFGEAAGETLALLDRFLLTMVLKRADIIS